MKTRVADFITNKLYEAGGECVFLVTGGMIMHLTDALYQHENQKFVCCHHEQSAVMAAEAYGRFTGKLGVAYVTAGPGALNTLTGVVGAYVDSSPCIIVSGQSKVSQTMVTGPRQFALQGFNTLPIFEQVTKYAVILNDLSRIRYEVEKCIYLATSHRVGPVWIESPIDIQGMYFDPDEFEGFNPPVLDQSVNSLTETVNQVAETILQSRRPCILGGAGIRLSNAIESFHKLIDKTRIPVLTSRLGMDLIDHHHPLFVGRPGTYGDRAANFTIQNSDLLLNIGCRLGIGLVGYDFQDFARYAVKICVDVDEQELIKPSILPDISVCSDAKLFIDLLLEKLGDYQLDNSSWRKQTQVWKQKYPVDLPEYQQEKNGVNSYHFMSRLSKEVSKDSSFLIDTGSCFHVFAQAFQVKFGQRHIITGGLSTMGYMPGAIGVATANQGREVFCITGDGSVQFNIQELQTIFQNDLPIKLIVLNNNGYLLIRLTQRNFQEGRFIGVDKDSGVSCPDMEKIASAYGIKFIRISGLCDLDEKLSEIIHHQGPLVCEVMTPPNQLLIPRVASKKMDDGRMVSMPYDDMFPFLPREEYLGNCVREKIV
ncbi:thiamine pyrophosphate-binding protein [Limnothrix sp. FACHB-708]|uniref:thiamine pyrophosphate-binding protein n=1 Tax=unclassified Limnothrix TaxID=2632864 RepID=UPI001682A264|nr:MULTISPECIES: thiamine pyrophosphate-binding protein [unclassified Limnothrix]MBD2552237.1 thiamine pyrophosphate-binding protein [Limnothrix sp. FACHB-708]MBD2592103.1 thiamine pyrophosphate-binding protein [Limnothrix sp. FACHB-406]